MITTLLTIFITLKLMGFLAWSWWLVLSPLWVYLVFVVIYLVIEYWPYKRDRYSGGERWEYQPPKTTETEDK